MKIKNQFKPLWLVVILSCFLCVPAMAAENADAQKNWDFQLAPFYLWMWTVDGDLSAANRTVDIGVNLTDLTDQLNAAYVANFQGYYKQKWGFFLDYNHVKFSEDGAQGPIHVDVDFRLQLVELDGLYRIDLAPGHSLDFKAGARYFKLDPTIKVSVINTREFDNEQDWVDPIIGARWVWRFADQWSLNLLGDIGGFGVGSEFTWQGVVAIDYKPFKNVSFGGGYRAIYVDYEDGTANTPDYFKFDATLHGPMIGLVIQW